MSNQLENKKTRIFNLKERIKEVRTEIRSMGYGPVGVWFDSDYDSDDYEWCNCCKMLEEKPTCSDDHDTYIYDNEYLWRRNEIDDFKIQLLNTINDLYSYLNNN